MYDLLQIYLDNIWIVDWNLSLADCLMEAARLEYIADGMATFACETEA